MLSNMFLKVLDPPARFMSAKLHVDKSLKWLPNLEIAKN